MESEREERKRSIRAARDWLAGAEDALAGADDVSGDLKLMLARAELACTTSTRRARLRRRARVLLPALALVALALWGLWRAYRCKNLLPCLPQKSRSGQKYRQYSPLWRKLLRPLRRPRLPLRHFRRM